MLLELKNIRKHFHSGRGLVKAVGDVTLAVNRGEHLGLVGESGCGKTTLGRIILKLYQPDSGSVLIDGRDWAKISSKDLRPLRRDVQVVFQDPYNSLDPRFNIQRSLAESLIHQKLTRAATSERMAVMLNAVGLDMDALRRFPHEFSGGERQRIAIARALLMSPKLLILDEAVSSLDVLIQAQILELLEKLAQEFQVTYFFITHNLRVVQKLCARTAVMYNGRIVEWGQTPDIFKNPLHPYTKELLAAALDYVPAAREVRYEFSQNSRLIDHGDGHFVLE